MKLIKFVWLLICAWACFECAAFGELENVFHDTPKDVFTITDEVKIKDAEKFRFGMNLSTVAGFAAWNSDMKLNSWSCHSAFEPVVASHGGIADGGGKDYLEHTLGSALHSHNCMITGFWDGGECWVYRIEDGEMRLLRKDKIKRCISGPTEENRLYFEQNGPSLRSGDIYALRKTFYESPSKYMDERFTQKEKKGIYSFGSAVEVSGNPWLLDREQKCPEGGSTTSLKMKFNEGGKNSYHAYFVNHGSPKLMYWNENKEYKFEIWMRQEGIPQERVTVEMGPFFKETFTVTDQWKKFEGTLNTDTFYGLAKLIDAELKRTGGDEEFKTLNDQLLALGEWGGNPPQDIQNIALRLESDTAKSEFWANFIADVPHRLEYSRLLSNASATLAINEGWIKKEMDKLQAIPPEEIAALSASKQGPYVAAAKKIAKILSDLEWSLTKKDYAAKSQAVVAGMGGVLIKNEAVAALRQRLENVRPRPIGYGDSHFRISADSGNLWLDNLIVWQTDVPKFGVMPWMRDALKDYRPGMIRIWKGLATSSVEAWVKDKFETPLSATYSSLESFNAFSLPESLRLCEYAESDPWLILNPYWTREELLDLMEYLYAPADIGYGKVRAAQGREKPWATEFETLYFECANEAWNVMFSPKAWPQNPEVYARIANYQFDAIKESPYFKKEQTRFVADGRADTRRGEWSQKVSHFVKGVDYQDFASYFGGWDGATVIGENDDELFFNQLMYSPQIIDPALIRAMNIDPNLHVKFAAVLSSDPALQSDLMKSIEVQPLDAALRNGATLAEQTFEIVTVGMDIPKKKLSDLRKTMNAPVGQMMLLSVKDEAFLPIFNEVYAGIPEGLIPRAASTMAEGPVNSVRFLNYVKNQGQLDALTQWADSLELEAEYGRAGLLTKGQLLAELKAFKEKGKGGYTFTGAMGQIYAPRILKKIEADPELVKNLKTTFSWNIGLKTMRDTNGRLDLILSDLCATISTKLLGVMKQNPEYATALLAQLKDNDTFLDVTARFVAEQLVLKASPVLSAPKGANEKYIALTEMPEPARSDLFDFMKQCAKLDVSQMDAGIPGVTLAMLDALQGNLTAMNALQDSQEFTQSIKTRILNGLSDAFLESMADDGDMALRIETGLTQLPEDPSVIKRSVYEAGPGYLLPGAGKSSPEESERMGKSITLGITTIDVFTANLAKGFGPQGYFTFKTGDYWSTHSQGGFPNPSFESLRMHNTYCRGDMMEVDFDAVRRVDIAEKTAMGAGMSGYDREIKIQGRKNVPLTMCYAYKKGKTHSIELINRNYRDTRTVKLNLPYEPAPEARLHILYHEDPSAGNRVKYEVKEQSKMITDFANGYEIQLPPHSLYIFEVNEK